MKSSITSKLTLAVLMVAISCAHTRAQQGDSKDTQAQIDPIPASEIPPSPLLTTENAIKAMQLAAGFKIQSIADENINQPVSLSFDADGRAWLVEMTQYMLDFDRLVVGKLT